LNGIDRIEASREVELEDPRFYIFCPELNGVGKQISAQVYKYPTHEVSVTVDDDDIGRRLTFPSIAYLLGQEIERSISFPWRWRVDVVEYRPGRADFGLLALTDRKVLS
jgi:hypothetical protein